MVGDVDVGADVTARIGIIATPKVKCGVVVDDFGGDHGVSAGGGTISAGGSELVGDYGAIDE